MDRPDNLLLDGIVGESQKKADAILSAAQKQAETIMEQAKKKAEDQVEDEHREQEMKLKQVQYRLEAGKASAKRRSALKRIDDNYNAVMDRVDVKFNEFARSEAFKPYLTQWIAEAAVGLDLKQAKVAFCPLCPVDQTMLRSAEALVKKATGSDVQLELDSKPIRKIGVVLSSLDDKVSYNNQVDIRMRRYDRDIRTLVQEDAWKAE